jgi:hypothetical protein
LKRKEIFAQPIKRKYKEGIDSDYLNYINIPGLSMSDTISKTCNPEISKFQIVI